MSVLDDNLHAATHRKVRKDHMSQILTSHHDKSKYVHNRGKGRAHKSSKHSAYQCSIVSEQLNRMESHLNFSNIVVHFPNGLCCDCQKMQQTQDKLCKTVSEEEETTNKQLDAPKNSLWLFLISKKANYCKRIRMQC